MVRKCPDCGIEFEPTGRNHKYCSKAHMQKAADRKRGRGTKSERVIVAKGSRNCTNCRSAKKGKRYCFWWDDDDRVEDVMETAFVLCAFCYKLFNSQRAKERAREAKWYLASQPPIKIIPF